ncbi:MAG: ABC transporter permease [Gammaproteobacteria bacterium]
MTRGAAFWRRRLAGDKAAAAALVLLLLLVFAALFAPYLSPTNPHDQLQFDIMDSEMPPAWISGGEGRFAIGTDAQGRDLLSAILYGLRISVFIGVFAVLLQAALGICIGLVAGYAGGRLDAVLMRIADIQLSFSTMMVAIVALALFQALFGAQRYEEVALYLLVFIIGVAEWPQYARTVRASVLAEKQKEYVAAGRVIGYSPARLMFRHILPNTMTPVTVISTVQVANAIISEAALSFLGLGMPVTRPSLGSLIHAGFEYIFSGAWWITFFPALALVLLILSVNMLGDFLRDALNPRTAP